ncbi:class IIb bacteriocin, lactobin A/cerein 7B family [Leptospira interrogans]
MQIDHSTQLDSNFRTLEAAELELVSGGLGPLAVVAIMAASAAAGAIAGVLTAPSKSGITWQQILNTAQGRPPA